MERKPSKTKKKTSFERLLIRGKMFRTPLLILFLLGTTNCDNSEDSILAPNVIVTDVKLTDVKNVESSQRMRHRHTHVQPSLRDNGLSDIKYLRRHLNKKIVNFVMRDVLTDGEVENRVHFNGITAKETSVGTDGSGLKLRQLTDGSHLVQVIYGPTGVVQDCEFITNPRSSRRFLKQLRKELKQALDEESYRLSETEEKGDDFIRHFGNVTFDVIKDGRLPKDVASWLDYESLKEECVRRHEELKYIAKNRNKATEVTLSRSRRSFRETFIVPGTKWCGAGQLANSYNELGLDRSEDKCCRAHDNCRMNIGAFKRRFGYFNMRPFTVSHCRCDRRFRACLKLADTSVSNMVGKLFFNVVQTKCFVLKPVKVCTNRSWWGKCLRKGYTKQAYLRDNLPY